MGGGKTEDGAHLWSQLISGHRILLVDDICTTGATLAECARVLREAGAADVVCAAAALTPLERDSGKKA